MKVIGFFKIRMEIVFLSNCENMHLRVQGDFYFLKMGLFDFPPVLFL